MNKDYTCQLCEPETNNVVGVQFSISVARK